MAISEVLSEMVGAIKLLRVTFAQLVLLVHMSGTHIPIRRHGKHFAAVTADIQTSNVSGGTVECIFDTREPLARP